MTFLYNDFDIKNAYVLIPFLKSMIKLLLQVQTKCNISNLTLHFIAYNNTLS